MNPTTQQPTYELLKDLPDEMLFKRYKNSVYYVSAYGKIYSVQTNKVLKGWRNKKGYLFFDLWLPEGQVSIAQHRIIAECFIPNPNNHPLVRHLNDNVFDIRIENLAWGTKSDNMNDAVRNGKIKDRPAPIGEKSSGAKLTAEKVISIRSEHSLGGHYKELAMKYGISDSHIYQIINRQAWKHI